MHHYVLLLVLDLFMGVTGKYLSKFRHAIGIFSRVIMLVFSWCALLRLRRPLKYLSYLITFWVGMAPSS